MHLLTTFTGSDTVFRLDLDPKLRGRVTHKYIFHVGLYIKAETRYIRLQILVSTNKFDSDFLALNDTFFTRLVFVKKKIKFCRICVSCGRTWIQPMAQENEVV